MRAIIWNHMQQLRRQPFAVLGMIVLTIVFSVALGQVSRSSQVEVPVYSAELSLEEITETIERLNKESDVHFILEEKEIIDSKLSQNAIEMALQVEKDFYKIFTNANSPNVSFVEAHVNNVLKSEAVLNRTAAQLNQSVEDLRQNVASSSELYSFTTKSFKEDDFLYDSSLQALFGFSLFFVIFTVSFTVSTILYQKRDGMWNRLILSPLSKVQLYLGNLIFSFLLGYIQLFLIFTLFRFVLGVNLYGGFPLILIAIIPYLFALVSLGVLISAIVSNPRQLDAVIPIISVSMAMIGGAYWPLEIVQSEILLKLSLFIPMTYGMEMLKGATILDWSLSQFFLPASILFCMGVLFMGVGLNLMERKAT
ncbi:ABC transporter permease [Sutcliffiella deserti]|uniref:ABC transporter permease n=1 Tax=Sutcliffiella deserti TaxID=2875501 RepID=UPI001CBC89AF|nr:ABC transporter permease [Sutcliffiella deserti]